MLLSRKAPLPQGWRPALIHHAPGGGRKWPGLPWGRGFLPGRVVNSSPHASLTPHLQGGIRARSTPTVPKALPLAWSPLWVS